MENQGVVTRRSSLARENEKSVSAEDLIWEENSASEGKAGKKESKGTPGKVQKHQKLVRRQSSSSVSSHRTKGKRKFFSKNAKRQKQSQASINNTKHVVVRSDDAPDRLVNPLIEWPYEANNPCTIGLRVPKETKVAKPAPVVEAVPAGGSEGDGLAEVGMKRIADMVRMLDLERPDTFSLAWQARVLGIKLPEVISVNESIEQQLREANTIDESKPIKVHPISRSLQWDWAKEEDDSKLLSTMDPAYSCLLKSGVDEKGSRRPVSAPQYNKLCREVGKVNTSAVLEEARKHGLISSHDYDFTLSHDSNSTRSFRWSAVFEGQAIGYIETEVEWYTSPILRRSELISQWRSISLHGVQWLAESIGNFNQAEFLARRQYRDRQGSTNQPVIDYSLASRDAETSLNTDQDSSRSPNFEPLFIILVALALEHARTCGIGYVLIRNMRNDLIGLLQSHFRMTAIEGRSQSLVCDLLKTSYRYAFLLFKQNATRDKAVHGGKEPEDDLQRQRWVAALSWTAESPILEKVEPASTLSGPAKESREKLARFRVSLSPQLAILPTGAKQFSNSFDPSAVEMKLIKYLSTRLQPGDAAQSTEICAAINEKIEELQSLERTVDPRLQALMVDVIKERIEFEGRTEDREKERQARECHIELLEQRREEHLAFQRKQEQDMEAVCEICADGEIAPDNQMVFCEACDVAVHQVCYGIQEVPEGDWFCLPCKRLRRNDPDVRQKLKLPLPLPVSCELCPLKNGAFIESASTCKLDSEDSIGKWTHVVCAKWQGLSFERSPDLIEDVTDLKARFRQHGIVCTLCGGARGAMNKCRHEKCDKWCHVTCARAVGSCVVIHGENAFGEIEENPWTVLCPDHSEIEKPTKTKGMLTIDELVKLAAALPTETGPRPPTPPPPRAPSPPPSPPTVVIKPSKKFDTVGGKERKRLLNDDVYEQALLEDLKTKQLFGYRCEVCDTLEDEGKHMHRCPSCFSICCATCKFPTDVQNGIYMCQPCRYLKERSKAKEETKPPACIACFEKGGVMREATASPIGRKSYWKSNAAEFKRSLFGRKIWMHSSCGFWVQKLDVLEKGVIECSNVVMANGKGLILANYHCALCGQSGGLKIKCNVPSCASQKQEYYHVTCARQAGLEVAVTTDEKMEFYLKCYRHGSNEHNIRARIEDLLEVEKRRSGTSLAKLHLPMTYPHAQRLLNAAIHVMRMFGWAWRWVEWWIEHDSTWEPLLEPGQIESEMSKEELRIVDSTRQSRCSDARQSRLAAFSVALRDRLYDNDGSFHREAFDRALSRILNTRSLVGPLTAIEKEFLVEWLGRAYRSRSRTLGFGDDKIEAFHGLWCLHAKDGSPKFRLENRPIPGMQKVESFEEVDDFLIPEREVVVMRAKATAKIAPPKKKHRAIGTKNVVPEVSPGTFATEENAASALEPQRESKRLRNRKEQCDDERDDAQLVKRKRVRPLSRQAIPATVKSSDPAMNASLSKNSQERRNTIRSTKGEVSDDCEDVPSGKRVETKTLKQRCGEHDRGGSTKKARGENSVSETIADGEIGTGGDAETAEKLHYTKIPASGTPATNSVTSRTPTTNHELGGGRPISNREAESAYAVRETGTDLEDTSIEQAERRTRTGRLMRSKTTNYVDTGVNMDDTTKKPTHHPNPSSMMGPGHEEVLKEAEASLRSPNKRKRGRAPRRSNDVSVIDKSATAYNDGQSPKNGAGKAKKTTGVASRRSTRAERASRRKAINYDESRVNSEDEPLKSGTVDTQAPATEATAPDSDVVDGRRMENSNSSRTGRPRRRKTVNYDETKVNSDNSVSELQTPSRTLSNKSYHGDDEGCKGADTSLQSTVNTREGRRTSRRLKTISDDKNSFGSDQDSRDERAKHTPRTRRAARMKIVNYDETGVESDDEEEESFGEVEANNSELTPRVEVLNTETRRDEAALARGKPRSETQPVHALNSSPEPPAKQDNLPNGKATSIGNLTHENPDGQDDTRGDDQGTGSAKSLVDTSTDRDPSVGASIYQDSAPSTNSREDGVAGEGLSLGASNSRDSHDATDKGVADTAKSASLPPKKRKHFPVSSPTASSTGVASTTVSSISTSPDSTERKSKTKRKGIFKRMFTSRGRTKEESVVDTGYTISPKVGQATSRQATSRQIAASHVYCSAPDAAVTKPQSSALANDTNVDNDNDQVNH